MLGPASAQIRTDGSVGPVSALTGPNFAIGANLGKQVGGNLFHSFSTFNVQTGQTATFSGPASVSNIIGRVTGGQTSQVDGQIASTIPNANLFLLNPSGWVFGSHATLNVQGSFHVSTADTLGFTDGTRVPAGTPNQSTFTVAQPQAFGFLSAHPGAIAVTGSTLATQAGKDLSIVGGPVQITGGQITAPAGHLHIASAAGPGDIGLNGADPSAQTVTSYGPITLTGNTIADVGDPTGQLGGGAVQVRGGAVLIDSSAVRATNHSGKPGGTVAVQADTLTLHPGGTITTTTSASGNAGAISIATTGAFTITGDGSTGLTGVSSASLPATSGHAGSVTVVSGGALTVTLGGQINNATFGTGAADPVSVTALTITLDAFESLQATTISSQAMVGSSGTPGTVTVRANDIALRAEGQIASLGTGTGGSSFVDVRATGAIDLDGTGNLSAPTGILSNVNPGSHGNAGGVLVQANSLTLANRGLISSSTFGAGNAGAVQVTGIGPASSITIDGGSLASATGIASNAEVGSGGVAGGVSVSADSINLLRTGQISGSTFTGGDAGAVTVSAGTLLADGGGRTDFGTGIFSNANSGSTGKAGSVAVTANVITLDNQGLINSSTFGTGNAGKVQVTGVGPASSITIDAGNGGPTGILSNAQSGSRGAAGSVVVSADIIDLLRTGQISSSTSAGGDAGTVTVNAATLSADGGGRTDFGTGIFSNANSGSTGKAGSVAVTANVITLHDQGFINSSTYGTGNAGKVQVTGTGPASSITIDGGTDLNPTGILSEAESGSTGAAGGVIVSVDNIQLLRTGQISSSTSAGGNAGTVTVNANTLSADGGGRTDFGTGIFSDANSGSTGAAGSVAVTANVITLNEQGLINSSTYGPGNAGKVQVTGTGPASSITIDGRTDVNGTGILSNAQSGSAGTAGSVIVSADSINLLRTGQISSSTFAGGDAGTVTVNAGTLSADGGGRADFGTGIFSNANSGSTGKAGSVAVSANVITLNDQGLINSSTFGTGNAGKVQVTGVGPASSITIDAGNGGPTGILSNAQSGSSGAAGSVIVSADTVSLLRTGQISSSTSASGDAGSVMVNANTLSADGGGRTDFGTGIFSNANSGSTGKAGSVAVTANVITLNDQGLINSSTYGTGNAGKVQVTGIGPDSSVTIDGGTDVNPTGILSEAQSGSTGAAGSVTVSMDHVSLLRTGQISSSTVAGGEAGSVTVNASTLFADGGGRTDFDTGVFSNADPGSTGKAGSVVVTANLIGLFAQGVISSSTFGPGSGGTVTVTTGELVALGSPGTNVFDTGVSTNAVEGTGAAGDINLSANVIDLFTNGRVSSSSLTSGRGGNVTVTGNTQPLDLTVSGFGASVRALASSPEGAGAGTITISAGKIALVNQGDITTQALAGGGGNVLLTASQLLNLDRGSITTSSQGGASTSNGGDVGIGARYVVLNDGTVQANADAGKGGDIRITASQYFASPGSLVQASSTLGISGTINIQAPDTNVPGTLAELSDRLLNIPSIQRQGCSGAAQSERTSSLVVGSRGGLPRNGEGPQPALYFNLDVPFTGLQAGRTQIDKPRTVAEANDVLSGCLREKSPEDIRLDSRIQ